MGMRRKDGRRLAFDCAVLVAAALILVGGSYYSYACIVAAEKPAEGRLEVATSAAPGAAWYDAEHAPPALTDQLTAIASNLYPGRSAAMEAFVRSSRSGDVTPTLAVASLTDTGGEWTPAERALQPTRDSGDLSASLEVTITYSSSRRPAVEYVVAHGSLRELAGRRSALAAPLRLRKYTKSSCEVGTWRIAVGIPGSVGDLIQGDRSTCVLVFGIAPGASRCDD